MKSLLKKILRSSLMAVMLAVICMCAFSCETRNLEYSLSDDGSYYSVIGPGDFEKSSTIKIPDKHNNLPVLYVSGFSEHKKLRSLKLGKNVEGILDNAFSGCHKLSSVSFNKNLRYIGMSAFSYCSKLRSVEFNEKLEHIDEYAFESCGSLYMVRFGSNLKEIGTSAFEHTCLSDVKIPESVLKIGYNSFGNTSNYSYNEFGGAAYLGSTNNPYYALIEVPKDENGKVLEHEIHADTRVIAQGVFYGCTRIGILDLPDKLKSIGFRAFAQCSEIYRVIIPATLEFIDDEAFIGAHRISEVYYKGTPEDFSNIQIGESNYGFGSGAWCYRETQPSEYGRFWHYIDGEPCVWLTSIPDSELLTYRLSDTQDYYIVTGVQEGEIIQYLSIPSSYNGLPVKEIDASAFAGKSSLKGVTIPEGVVKIGNKAFSGCRGIVQVDFPDTLVSVGSHAFDSSQVHEVHFSDSVTEIGSWCFFNANKIHLGKGITGDLSTIMEHGWADYTSVSESNPTYSSKDGSLYSKDGSILLKYSSKAGEQIVKIDDGVKIISSCAFENADDVKMVIVGESVEKIEKGAFDSSEIVEVVVNPEKVDCKGKYICQTIYSLSSDMHAFGDPDEIEEKYPDRKIYYYSDEDPYIEDLFWRFDGRGNIVIWHPMIRL